MRTFIRILKTFHFAERLIFVTAFSTFVIAGIFLFVQVIEQKTTAIPVAGGEYTEGLIGQPSFINPVLIANNEVDRDLAKLIFSDLLGLSESRKVSDDGKIWTVRLKENIFWHDGEKITSDDVIFTIKTIQDPDANSPQSPNWRGVMTERASEREIKFILPISYAFFESTLEELHPIPKHIFNDIPTANLKLSAYNLEPVGSGKFKFISAEKQRSGFIEEYKLARNENYEGQKLYIEKFNLAFFANEDDLLNAFNSGKINGFGGISPKKLQKIKISHQIHGLKMPRYYAVFFNANASPALKEKNVRLALNYAVDRKNIIKKTFNNQAESIAGPLTPGMEGFDADVYLNGNFSSEKAKQLLNENSENNGDLKFNLAVPEISFLVETANLLKEDWNKLGLEVNLIILPLAEINQEIIKTRNYQMILFGNNIGRSPDLFSFWHSSERFYPGLNLSLFENKNADNLIEAIRKDFNKESRARKLSALQSLIIEDQPAIFLYSPNYLYVSQNNLKGFEERFIYSASDRFNKVEKWHVKTARVFQ